jgi:hypothetical protein
MRRPDCLEGDRHHADRADLSGRYAATALSRRPGSCSFSAGPVANRMKRISYSGCRFTPEIIQQAIWLYLRFTLSLRAVDDLLAERGITVLCVPKIRFGVDARNKRGKLAD